MSHTTTHLEAHASVLRQELTRLDEDAATLASIQARYSGLLPPPDNGRQRSKSASSRPATASKTQASSSDAPLLGGALNYLSEVRASKVHQLSAIVDQQSAVASAVARANALVEDVRSRDLPPSITAPPLPPATNGGSGWYEAPSYAVRPTITPSAHRDMSATYSQREHYAAEPTRPPQAEIAPIGFDPPLVVGGWRSYLKVDPGFDGAGGSHLSPSRMYSAGNEAAAAGNGQHGSRISFSSVGPTAPAHGSMLVVLPSGTQTNLRTGIVTANRR
jgi:hypothetical protein